MTTSNLARLVRNRSRLVMMCRDHCGPYFRDDERSMSLGQAIERCLATIDDDIENGYELIHIDVGRVPGKDRYAVAEKLICRAIDQLPSIMIEFGSEDNDGRPGNLGSLREDLLFLEQYRRNVRFVTFPTGTLVKAGQVGSFDERTTLAASAMISEAGYLLKEHNADYLSCEEIRHHFSSGVHAMNVAPQLGVMETEMTRRLASNQSAWSAFRSLVYENGNWTKWIGGDDANECAIYAGHYHHSSAEFHVLRDSCDNHQLRALLTRDLFRLIDSYMGG